MAIKAQQMIEGSKDDRLPVEVIRERYLKEGSKDYALLDTGEGRKLERVGNILIDRQCPVAFWSKHNRSAWTTAQAVHQRSETGGGHWKSPQPLPDFWFTQVGPFVFKTKLTAFGHLGFFVEQVEQWKWLSQKISQSVAQQKEFKVLNLFAYTGGSSIACALAGAHVTHVDAAKGVVDWARQNAALNEVSPEQIRYAVEDCALFLEREAKRGNSYDGIIMDPPSFGRGPNKEIFKIEDDILPLLKKVKAVLKPNATFFHFSSHSQGFSPEVLKNLSAEILPLDKYAIEGGEMLMSEENARRMVPSGQFVRLWLL